MHPRPPPRLSSAGLEEPPPSYEAGPGGPHRAAHPASQLEGAWQRRSRSFTSALRVPPRLPALSTPATESAKAQARDGRTARWDARGRLAQKGRAPSGGLGARSALASRRRGGGAILALPPIHKSPTPIECPSQCRAPGTQIGLSPSLQGILILRSGSDYQSMKRALIGSSNLGLASGKIFQIPFQARDCQGFLCS